MLHLIFYLKENSFVYAKAHFSIFSLQIEKLMELQFEIKTDLSIEIFPLNGVHILIRMVSYFATNRAL